MGLFNLFSRKPTPVVAPDIYKRAPNPHSNDKVRTSSYHVLSALRSMEFTSGNEGRLLEGWATASNTVDYYLRTELRPLRARSRKMVRSNPYGKRFISSIKSNVIGPRGVTIQAQSKMGNKLDTPANDAIEAAFHDWATNWCDFKGKLNWVDIQNLAISCAAQDGEFLVRKHYGVGKYGLQLEIIDPELLNVDCNRPTTSGGEIRMGVEYSKNGRIVRYHFKSPNAQGAYDSGYRSGDEYTVEAESIIHGFIQEWPDQSRGAPWMHPTLERSKHLEKYEEAAIVKARSTAATMAVLKTPAGDPSYTGSEEGAGEYDDATLDQYEAGTIKDIGDREVVNLDSDYPHQMYASFVKSQLQGIASGMGISYHSLSNDLEGVNYSSIRAGVLEDREVYKGLQNWFIRCFICPVYEEWLMYSWVKQIITIGTRPLARPINEYFPAHYQARRWAWVDPQKDGAANQLAIDYRLKSPSQIMREQGDDPESVWREIQRDQDIMNSLGIAPVVKTTLQEGPPDDDK